MVPLQQRPGNTGRVQVREKSALNIDEEKLQSLIVIVSKHTVG